MTIIPQGKPIEFTDEIKFINQCFFNKQLSDLLKGNLDDYNINTYKIHSVIPENAENLYNEAYKAMQDRILKTDTFEEGKELVLKVYPDISRVFLMEFLTNMYR